MDAVWPYLAAIIPSAVVAVLFYLLMKRIIEGDRRERLAQSRFEAEQDRLASLSKLPGNEGGGASSDPEGPDHRTSTGDTPET